MFFFYLSFTMLFLIFLTHSHVAVYNFAVIMEAASSLDSQIHYIKATAIITLEEHYFTKLFS